jgi:hypothetical protein
MTLLVVGEVPVAVYNKPNLRIAGIVLVYHQVLRG